MPDGRPLALVAGACVAMLGGAGGARAATAPDAASAPDAVSASSSAAVPLVRLLAPHRFFSRPARAALPRGVVRSRRPITGDATVLPVLDGPLRVQGWTWLRVRLPGRVLGAPSPPREAWIRAWGTRAGATWWRLVVDTRARTLVAYHAGIPRRRFPVIVGKPSTPTPHGEFYIEENVRLPSWAVGAPFALATSARSNVLQEFDGGPGQIALHGLRGVGGRLGTAVSHGCVRLGLGALTWLARRMRPGVPVTIR